MLGYSLATQHSPLVEMTRSQYNPASRAGGIRRPAPTTTRSQKTVKTGMTNAARTNAIRGLIAISATFSMILTGPGCASPPQTPRLTVVIVVDMLPAAFLTRFEDHFGDGGFKRMMKQGAWFTNARFDFGTTLTSPGHATIATGANPSEHGIVANYWYTPGSSERIYSVADSDVRPRGTTEYGAAAHSPHRLEVSTIGDDLKRAYPGAKVWSMALKPHASVFLGGHFADGVIWWSSSNGEFVSSSYYFDTLPEWCASLNSDRFSDSFFHATWDRVLPDAAYSLCREDVAPYETGARVFWTNAMPKVLAKNLPQPNKVYYKQLEASPFGNELVFEVARRAVMHESLGADDTPDLLFISLSANDNSGHLFGPDSHEIFDLMVRTDGQLAAWFDFLDKRIGLEKCLVLLTGDHGAGMAPERARHLGLDGGRLDIRGLFDAIDDELTSSLGTPPGDEYYLTGIQMPWIYLNAPLLDRMNIDLDTAASAVADYAASYDGIETAVSTADILNRPLDSLTSLERLVRNNVFEGRSGEVYLHLKPHWTRTGICADHGTAHDYDRHVPVMFMGSAFRPGVYDQPVDMRDPATTLRAVLGVASESTPAGRVLREALVR